MPELEFNTSTLAASMVGAMFTLQLTSGNVPSGPVSFRRVSFIPLLWGGRDSCSFLVAQTVKNLPAMPETWVQSLGWKEPLEEEMATHSSVFAWEIPWTEEPGGLQSMGLQRVGHY